MNCSCFWLQKCEQLQFSEYIFFISFYCQAVNVYSWFTVQSCKCKRQLTGYFNGVVLISKILKLKFLLMLSKTFPKRGKQLQMFKFVVFSILYILLECPVNKQRYMQIYVLNIKFIFSYSTGQFFYLILTTVIKKSIKF